MKISTILDHIDSGHIALPEFQRGYVWNRDQVRSLFNSLYRRHPVGGLLVWATQAHDADGDNVAYRGDTPVATGVVNLLLDGQQRITSLYGMARGRPPKFFDGNEKAFTGLRFHVENEEFAFYQPVKMRDDPLWIDVSDLMQSGTAGLGTLVSELTREPSNEYVGRFVDRLSRVLGILDVDLHVEEVTGQDKDLDVVVDIFNRVNSGGTKLSKGDLALAKICADWPEARDEMKAALAEWGKGGEGYQFDLDWLLRCMNTILTGEARFQYLHELSPAEIQDGLKRAAHQINRALTLIDGRLGLDHDRVLFGRYAIPVMVRYLDHQGAALDESVTDKLLFWYLHAGMWGRFSGSIETVIDQDIAALESQQGLDALLESLRLWHGALRVQPGHFVGWSLGARFYPVLYLLTRIGSARDWGTGQELKSGMLGQMNRLEVHHIFPKAQLYKRDYRKPEVNAVANFCLQTKETNLWISDRLPEEYFEEVERKHPGALASQWVPMDRELWKIENFPQFLEARRVLLAEAANGFLEGLLHGDLQWMAMGPAPELVDKPAPLGGIENEAEEEAIEELDGWVVSQGLPHGVKSHELVDPDTGRQVAVLDLAWPDGLQEELSEPVAVLLNEGDELIALANKRGFRCYVTPREFREYVEREVLGESEDEESERALERGKQRRERFNFEMVGLAPGAEIYFLANKDDEPSNTAIVKSHNRVVFEEEERSLSWAAGELLNRRGLSSSIAGPEYWYFEDESLAERRRRLEAEG